jgi:hypothetical protein
VQPRAPHRLYSTNVLKHPAPFSQPVNPPFRSGLTWRDARRDSVIAGEVLLKQLKPQCCVTVVMDIGSCSKRPEAEVRFRGWRGGKTRASYGRLPDPIQSNWSARQSGLFFMY